MILKYCDEHRNLGDDIAPVLFEHLSEIKPTCVNLSFPNKSGNDIYIIVGSILRYADEHTIVWGAGFISEEDNLKQRPTAIHAVRGPLTRKKVIDQGCICPEIYGDPVLLYPQFYITGLEKKYKLGIIPHYVDKTHTFLNKFKDMSDILVIDIQEAINKVVDKICSCEYIASSSLHGLIVADAYRIPTVWLEFSDKVIGKGFKFRDYFEAVHRKDEEPLVLNENTSLQQIYDKFEGWSCDIDLNRLYESCPFKK